MVIYHDSMQGTLQKVLRTTYPVCCQIVGEAFFSHLVRGYILQTPHSEPDITGFGERFPAFVAALLPSHQLCYLADVAALEWACHRARNGQVVPLLDKAALAHIEETQQGELRFSLYQDSTLMSSSYPILRIWEAHQAAQVQETISLDEGESRLLIHVRDGKLCLAPLSIEAFKMLTYFSAGMSFEVVCQKCHEEYPLLNIPQLFAECIAKKYLVSFELAKRS